MLDASESMARRVTTAATRRAGGMPAPRASLFVAGPAQITGAA
jgi:hypothetical protein